MKINLIEKIDSNGGDFIVLVDYGSEGLVVGGQYPGVKEAVLSLAGGGGLNKTIVYLPDVHIE